VTKGLILFAAVVIALCFVAAAAAAQPQAPAQAAEKTLPSGTVAENMATVTATVEKIDVKKRLVTLRTPDGEEEEFEVDPAVKNLPQVKKGDQIVVKYYESLAYEVKKPTGGSVGAQAAEALATAKPGEKPAGVGGRQVTVTAAIVAIDMTAMTVTLKGPQGNLFTVKARNPENLKAVSVGDLVDITYTQALAVSVEPAPKK
jgi:hypothetical protein